MRIKWSLRVIDYEILLKTITASDVIQCHGRTFATHENLLKALKTGVVPDCVCIEVRRSCVVDDALRAALKKKFDPSKSLKVTGIVYTC